MALAVAQVESARDCTRWSAAIPGNSPTRRWSEIISAGITEMDVSSPAAARFNSRWQRYGLGPVDLNILSASAQRVVKSAAIVSRTRSPDYELVYVRSGTGLVEHCGARFRVPQGSFVLLNDEQPFELLFDGESNCLSAHLTERWLTQWVPHPSQLLARPLPGTQSWGAPLAAMLTAIADFGLHGIALSRCAIADQCGALFALMAGIPSGVTTRHNGELLARLKQQLRARCYESELNPGVVAATVGISKRHLHGVFAGAGTTFGATLLETRLNRAAGLLTDRRYRAFSVTDIACECGFADASHFSRRFKQRFGCTPLGCRRAGLSDR